VNCILTLMFLTLLWNLFRAFLGLVFMAPVWVASGLWSSLPKSWLSFLVLAVALLAPHPAEAGWFSWLWGGSDTRQIERSAELAQEAARVAAQAAEAQSHQAAAQAEQNSRVAEVLDQLSSERQSLTEQIATLAQLSLQDSKLAAVLDASGPVLICMAGLIVAALALWIVNRQSANDPADLAGAMDVLVEEAAVRASEAPGLYGRESSSLRLGRNQMPALIGNAARDAGDQPDEAPMPF